MARADPCYRIIMIKKTMIPDTATVIRSVKTTAMDKPRPGSVSSVLRYRLIKPIYRMAAAALMLMPAKTSKAPISKEVA